MPHETKPADKTRPQGVTCVKVLLEAGFDVTGFERNQYVGGLWKWSRDEGQTTVLNGE